MTPGKCLIIPQCHLTLTSKCSGVNLIKAEIYQLNTCFHGCEKEGQFADQMENAHFGSYSLNNARFPECVIVHLGNCQVYLQKKNDTLAK